MSIGVIVPAANEQDVIGRCLSGLLIARAHAEHAGLDVRIVVGLDSCTDHTAEIVATFPGVETTRCFGRNVGNTRAAATDTLLRGDPALTGLLIASTDADSSVPADWLTQRAAEAANSDLMLGLVTPDLADDGEMAERWRSRHTLAEGHRHVFGANLAVRADTYVTVGGWRGLATGEDRDLAARVADQGGRVHRTARATVTTSARVVARAPHGFGAYLRAMTAE